MKINLLSAYSLIFFLFFSAATSLLSLLEVLSLNTAWTSLTEGRFGGEVNMLLRVQSHNERWDIDDLLADTE